VKGPASVLYGRMEPGGMANSITKKPLPSASYSIEQQIGSHSNYVTTVDVGGPLVADGSLRYRLGAWSQFAAADSPRAERESGPWAGPASQL